MGARIVQHLRIQRVHRGNVLRSLHGHDPHALLSRTGGSVGPRLQHGVQLFFGNLVGLVGADGATVLQNFQCFLFHVDPPQNGSLVHSIIL